MVYWAFTGHDTHPVITFGVEKYITEGGNRGGEGGEGGHIRGISGEKSAFTILGVITPARRGVGRVTTRGRGDGKHVILGYNISP